MKTTAERRHNTITKQHRKVDIVKDVYNIHSVDPLLANKRFIGKLKKGKVHCSCSMCSTKTKTHGLKHSEKIKVESAEYSKKEI